MTDAIAPPASAALPGARAHDCPSADVHAADPVACPSGPVVPTATSPAGPAAIEATRPSANAGASGTRVQAEPSGDVQNRARAGWFRTPASPPAPGNGVFGYAYIYDVGGGIPKYTLPIQHDATTGNLSFEIPPPDPSNPSSTGITPGNYEMEAYVDYKGDDGKTRQYDYFINPNSLSESHRIPVSVTSASTIGASVAIPPVFLDLQSSVSVCP